MSLWVDKYRPTSLGKLDYHKDQAVQLKNLVGNFNTFVPLSLALAAVTKYLKRRVLYLLYCEYFSGESNLDV